MRLIDHPLYKEDLTYITNLPLPWEKLRKKKILITGATGMVGSFIVDALMRKNKEGLGVKVLAAGRNYDKAAGRFPEYLDEPDFRFVQWNAQEPLRMEEKADFILNLASNTHPVAYATDPIGTVSVNVIGTNYILAYAAETGAERVLFASSNEIYGENRGDTELFDESYCGYIDSNTLRAGYPESKRCGEALCQAYIRQKGLNIVIPRLTRSYGPTLLSSDTKALSQFLRNGLAKEEIVLKSAGTQYYSYTYVADAAAGIFYCLLLGECGEAYNIADEAGDIMLKDLAWIIAETAGTKVRFELPNETEAAGFSKATKARLNGTKIKNLGWQMRYPMREGIRRTMQLLEDIGYGA